MSSSCTLHTNFDTPRQGTPQNIVPSHARNKLKKPNPKKNLNLLLFILILRIFMHPIESAKPWPKLKTTTDKERRRFNNTLRQILPKPLRLHAPDPRQRIHQSQFSQIQPRITTLRLVRQSFALLVLQSAVKAAAERSGVRRRRARALPNGGGGGRVVSEGEPL